MEPTPRQTPAAFARRIGVSRQRVNTLLMQGLPRDPDGLVPVALALRWIDENVDPARSFGQRHGRRGHKRQASHAALRDGGRDEQRPAGMPIAAWRHRDQPELYGYLLAAGVVMREIEATVAMMAVAAGAPMRVAYAAAQAVSMALACTISELLPDPDMSWLERTRNTNWPALAARAGEEVDFEAWKRWAAERFREPGPESEGSACK